jgi:hypothetical protein
MSEVRVDFKSDTSQVDSSISKIKGGIGTIGTAAKGLGASLKTAFAPLLALGAALGAISAAKGVIDLGGDLDDLSTSTGIAVDKLVVLQNAFELAGLSGDLVGKAVLGLNNKLEAPTPKIIDTLSKLGLSFQSIENLSMEERFTVVSKAIGGLADQNDRAAASSALFGGALGRGLLPLFVGGASAIDDATRNVGRLGQTMSENAPAFAKIGDALDSVAVKSKQFFAALIGANADKLVEIADAFMGIDLTKAGEQVGQMLNTFIQISKVVIDAFGEGTLGKTFENALRLGWLNFKPVLLSGMEIAAEVFTSALIEGISASFSILGKLVPESVKTLATANKVITEMNKDSRASRTGLTPEELAEKDALEKGFKLSKEPILGPALPPKEKKKLEPLLGPAALTTDQKKAVDLFTKMQNKEQQDTKSKTASLMENLFGSGSATGTSLQRIGGASGLTGSFNEVRETNSILRRIEQILAKQPTQTTQTLTSTAAFA